MRNFDIIKDIDGLGIIYRYCATAEDFQVNNPMISAQQARLALETMVKTVYRLKGWQIGEQASLLSLTTDERFTGFIDSEDLMKRIHYVRKIGNTAAHAGDGFVGRRESFFAVLNLYYIIGSIMLAWQVIDSLPDFDKELIPQTPQTNPLAVVPQTDQANTTTTQAATTAAQAVEESSDAQPATVEAQPVVNDLSEAETRRLYIDLLLHEAGWKISERKGEIIARQACIEVEVQGMPNESGVGYADYVLFNAGGMPLAVIEAKRTSKNAAEGRHQAELYADCLAARYACPRPVIYHTNGFETNIIDGIGYPSRKVMGFHTIDELQRMISQRGRNDITDLTISDKITNRNYQKRVIASVCGHYNKKHRRALLVMATGTGKTRVSISLVDVLVRNNWVKNVLFLADRIELVNQAKKNYTKLLPDITVSSLRDSDVDMSARILFSTYQTMIGHLDKDSKTFSLGRFDLIIIDEAHRSVFGKYGAIFDYFDGLLLGLTATPRDEVDRSTYDLFGMEQGEPTDSYEYDEAVADGYLNPFKAIKDNSQILTEGINPEQLSPEERKQLEEIFEYEKMMAGLEPNDPYSRTINATEIFKYIFNQDTVDHVLNRLMNEGVRVNEDTMIGKTIIFAYNHKHAVFIAERFAALYPDLGPVFCRVIDNYEKYSSDLLDKFADKEKQPQIAVSVDMLDTGIDVPEIVNSVFFKPIHSKIKFWQMIGRGTRLCENLFGEGLDKKEFLIFDFYRNFEYFEMNPEGARPTQSQSIVGLLFNLRTDIKFALQDGEYQTTEETKAFHDNLADILHQQIDGLNRNWIDVRLQLRAVETYANPESMICLTLGDIMAMKDKISPLLKNATTDTAALKFDALILKSQLALVDNTINSTSSERKIMDIAGYLKEKKASIPQVMAKMDVLDEVLSVHFWESKSLSSLECVRKELRDLIQYLDGGTAGQTFTINVKDTFEEDNSNVNITPIRTYRRRVEDYLKEHLSDDALQKIYHLEPLSEQDINRLEQIF
ncbi:DEAD/DEAH box helicase family protein [Bacteroides heparinolyticus]|uniref:DEAD/DEAH box helicase family protein n=1 Tax=Prevotella heparinolytica TaxID=28113 RepID=UPI0023F1CEE5|nr:DEAD/DEAH box helicase family protein [Bacteroides heparinolyticus]